MSAEATRLPGGSQQSADVAEPSGCCPALDTLQHLWLEIHRHNLATLAYGLGDGKRQAAGAAAQSSTFIPGCSFSLRTKRFAWARVRGLSSSQL
jgi:hypothetical protein